MSETFQQNTTGAMAYPSPGTFNRLIFKTPLILWRMGLGPLLSSESMSGSKMLVLTTWGRKSHLPRHSMLSYARSQGKLYVLAGWGAQADWVRNIQANPTVTVQVGGKVFSARAARVEDLGEFTTQAHEMFRTGGDSHFKPWLESLGIEYSPYDLIAKRNRVYVYSLLPADEQGPPPLDVDLHWVWGVIFASIGVGWLLGRRPYRKLRK